MMNWDDLRYLVSAVEAGSLSGAAKALGVTHSTVGRRLDALEQALGVRLLHRRAEGLALTDLGKVVLARAHVVREETSAIKRQLRGQDERLRGRVTLAMADLLSPWLASHMRGFVQRYPEIEVDLGFRMGRADLARGEADLALRLVALDDDPAPGSHLARRIGGFSWAIYRRRASEPQPDPREDLTGTNLLAFNDDVPIPLPAELLAWQERVRHTADHVIRTNHAPIVADLLRADVGVGALPCVIGELDGALERVSDSMLHCTAWLVLHPDLQANAAVRALWSYLIEQAEADAHLFTGGAVGDR